MIFGYDHAGISAKTTSEVTHHAIYYFIFIEINHKLSPFLEFHLLLKTVQKSWTSDKETKRWVTFVFPCRCVFYHVPLLNLLKGLIDCCMCSNCIVFKRQPKIPLGDKDFILSFDLLKALSYFYLLKMEQSVS